MPNTSAEYFQPTDSCGVLLVTSAADAKSVRQNPRSSSIESSLHKTDYGSNVRKNVLLDMKCNANTEQGATEKHVSFKTSAMTARLGKEERLPTNVTRLLL